MAVFTVVYLTYRPGGIDLLAESLKYQPSYLYELVVIDDYPGRAERGEAAKYLTDRGIPLRHYGTSAFAGMKGGVGAVRAMNAGAMWSRLDWTIFVQDYSWFQLGAMIQWAKTIKRYATNSIISGIACVHECEPPQQYGDVTIWKEPWPKAMCNVHEEQQEWVPRVFEAFHFGCPTGLIDAMNGFDEAVEWSFTASIVFQATCLGHEAIVDRTIRIDMMNHRQWVDDTNPTLWLCERVKEWNMPVLNVRSPNPYNFGELRRERCKVDG